MRKIIERLPRPVRLVLMPLVAVAALVVPGVASVAAASPAAAVTCTTWQSTPPTWGAGWACPPDASGTATDWQIKDIKTDGHCVHMQYSDSAGVWHNVGASACSTAVVSGTFPNSMVKARMTNDVYYFTLWIP